MYKEHRKKFDSYVESLQQSEDEESSEESENSSEEEEDCNDYVEKEVPKLKLKNMTTLNKENQDIKAKE